MKKMLLVLGVVLFECVTSARGVFSPEVRRLVVEMKEQAYSDVAAAAFNVVSYNDAVAFLHKHITFDLFNVLTKNAVKFINLSTVPVSINGIFHNGLVKDKGVIGGSESVVFEKPDVFDKFLLHINNGSTEDSKIVFNSENRKFNFVWINVNGYGEIEFECI